MYCANTGIIIGFQLVAFAMFGPSLLRSTTPIWKMLEFQFTENVFKAQGSKAKQAGQIWALDASIILFCHYKVVWNRNGTKKERSIDGCFLFWILKSKIFLAPILGKHKMSIRNC